MRSADSRSKLIVNQISLLWLVAVFIDCVTYLMPKRGCAVEIFKIIKNQLKI